MLDYICIKFQKTSRTSAFPSFHSFLSPHCCRFFCSFVSFSSTLVSNSNLYCLPHQWLCNFSYCSYFKVCWSAISLLVLCMKWKFMPESMQHLCKIGKIYEKTYACPHMQKDVVCFCNEMECGLGSVS